MARIEKTVFISYRRADESWGLAIFQDLTHHGYDVFIDYDGIASGNFETVILENIRARAHFLVLLTPTALERCADPNDWMRREIEAALDSQRNIVPVMLAGFDFGKPPVADQLTGKLAEFKKYNGLDIPRARFFSSEMERLRNRFLNVPVAAVLHRASLLAQQAATEQKDKATMALGEAPRQPWLSPEERRKQRLEQEPQQPTEENSSAKGGRLTAKIAGCTAFLVAIGALIDAVVGLTTRTPAVTCSLGISFPWCAAPAPKTFNVCFGEGGGPNCWAGADVKLSCAQYAHWNEQLWNELAASLCNKNYTKVRTESTSGGACGWTAYRITCN
jgi:hypothetical protein